MSDGALEPLIEAVNRLVRGLPVTLTNQIRVETRKLDQALARDEWTFGPIGSKNTPFHAATAAGRWDLIALACEREATQGVFGAELGSPGVHYFTSIVVDKMLALRELSEAGDGVRAAHVARALRAAFAWDALISFPAGRLRDRVLIADRVVESRTPQLTNGLTVGVVGNRWTPNVHTGEMGPTSDDAHSTLLMHALDWQPRRGRARERLDPDAALTILIGTTSYSAPTSPEFWGLTAEERTTLCAVVRGDVESARIAATWILGCKPARLPDHPDPWRFRLRRMSEGTESIFFGPWPNPNKPARAATQVLADCTWLGLQPSSNKKNPAMGYRVELRDGQIVASSEQSNGEHSIPELGGELLWQVDISGLDVTFAAGGAA